MPAFGLSGSWVALPGVDPEESQSPEASPSQSAEATPSPTQPESSSSASSVPSFTESEFEPSAWTPDAVAVVCLAVSITAAASVARLVGSWGRR